METLFEKGILTDWGLLFARLDGLIILNIML